MTIATDQYSHLKPRYGFLENMASLGPASSGMLQAEPGPAASVAPFSGWAIPVTTVSSTWLDVIWVGALAKFVAVANSGTSRVGLSTDGKNWTGVAVTASAWSGVAYSPGQNRLVAVGTNAVMTSDNGGTSWTDRTPVSNNSWLKVAYSAPRNIFVAVADGGTDRIMSSTDGVTWVSRSPLGGQCVTWSDDLGLFVIPRRTTCITSPDGITWTVHAGALEDVVWRDVTYSPRLGLLVCCGAAGTNRMATSVDGITWRMRTPPVQQYYGVIDAPEIERLLVISRSQVNNGLQKIKDFSGASWEGIDTVGSTQNLERIAWSGPLGLAVACSSSGTHRFMYSVSISAAHLTDWVGVAASDTSSTWRDVVWGNGKYVAVADTGVTHRAMYSTTGLAGSWTNGNGVAELLGAWQAVCYSATRDEYLAVANSGTNRAMTSPDGITWTVQAGIAAQTWTDVIWAPSLSLYIACCDAGTSRITTSPDGVTWTLRTAGEASTWQSIAWDSENNKAVSTAFSGTNRTQYSTDGTTWTAVANAEANQWRDVTRDTTGNLWWATAGSGTNRAQYSTDGTSWTAKYIGDGEYYNVLHSPEYNCIVALTRADSMVVSYDGGTTWIGMAAAETAQWNGLAYSPTLQRFVAVAVTGTNRVMYST